MLRLNVSWEKTKIYIIRFSNFIKLGDYNRTIVFIWSVYKKYGVMVIILMFSIITEQFLIVND